MLDFAIFAVTFLLALVGAVLYLYPVTPTRDSGMRLRREDLGGRSAGESRGTARECVPGAHACCGGWAVVLGGSRIPRIPEEFAEVALNYLG